MCCSVLQYLPENRERNLNNAACVLALALGVFSAEYRLFYRALLQKRPTILLRFSRKKVEQHHMCSSSGSRCVFLAVSVLQCVAVCCSVLQRVAACCSGVSIYIYSCLYIVVYI